MPVRPRTADELPPSSRPLSEPDPDRFDWEAMERAQAMMDRDSHQNDYYIDSYGNVAKRRQPPSLRKFKEEPLVPIGVAATAATLIAAGRQFRKGDAGKMNRFLWWRVYAQGFTVVAMIFGGILWESKRAERTENEARNRGWDVEKNRVQAGWTADGTMRANGRRVPSFWDPWNRAVAALRRT